MTDLFLHLPVEAAARELDAKLLIARRASAGAAGRRRRSTAGHAARARALRDGTAMPAWLAATAMSPTAPATRSPMCSPARPATTRSRAAPAAAGTTGAKPDDAARTAAAQAALEAKIRQVSQSIAAAYGEIVALLARSPKYRHFSLADLEWLVAPPLLANQFRLVSGKVKGQAGLQVPLGVAFWAFVSPEVTAKLEAQQKDGAVFRLAAREWKSGDIPWLLDIVAPPEVAKAMHQQLKESVFTGKQPRGYGEAA